MDREGGNKEKMRKCRDWISLHFLHLSPFPLHFLIRSPFSHSQADTTCAALYLIFVSFFKQHQFEAEKLYNWKCINARQKIWQKNSGIGGDPPPFMILFLGNIQPMHVDEVLPYKRPENNFFSQWSYSLWKRNLKNPNICFKLLWAQISAWAVFEYLFNSSPKHLRSEGKSKKKNMVRFVVLCILSTRPTNM